jgi:hypothetical protein
MSKIMVYKKFYKGESLQGYIHKLEMWYEAFLIRTAKTPKERNRLKDRWLHDTERVPIPSE